MVTLIPEAVTLLGAECRRRRCRFPKVINYLVRTHLAPPSEEEETAWMAERDAAWERIQKDPRVSHMDLGDEDLTFMSQLETIDWIVYESVERFVWLSRGERWLLIEELGRDWLEGTEEIEELDGVRGGPGAEPDGERIAGVCAGAGSGGRRTPRASQGAARLRVSKHKKMGVASEIGVGYSELRVREGRGLERRPADPYRP